MKKLLMTFIIFCTTQALFAQEEKLFVSDSSKSILQQQLLFPNRIIGKTNNGTVYALPQDNMPVFVPDSSFTSNMPVTNKTLPYQPTMPNHYSPRNTYPNNSTQKVDSFLKTTPFKLYEYKQRPAPKEKIER